MVNEQLMNAFTFINTRDLTNYLKMSQLSQNVPAFSKYPNYLKMSQLSQNVQTNYFKILQLPPKGRIILLKKLKIVRKYAK